MPANITFPEFTDPTVFLLNMEAANTLFESLRVPDATTNTFGVVKRAANVTALAAIALTAIEHTTVLVDGSEQTENFVGHAEVQAALDDIRTKLNDIITALRNAGVMV